MTAKRMPTPLSYRASETFDTINAPDGHTVVLFWKRAPITGPADAQLFEEHKAYIEYMVHCVNSHEGLVEVCKAVDEKTAVITGKLVGMFVTGISAEQAMGEAQAVRTILNDLADTALAALAQAEPGKDEVDDNEP